MANVFSGTASSVRTPYLAVSIGGYNLSPIPPKYIKSLNVVRTKEDSAGTFKLDLVSPVSAFDKSTSSGFSLVLAYLFALSLNASNENQEKINILYGWQGGNKTYIRDGLVTSCDISLDSSSGNILNFSVSGTTPTIFKNCFEKNFYQISQFAASKNKADTDFKTSITSFGPGRRRLSDIIQILANYLYSDMYKVSVDHVDKQYNDGVMISSISSFKGIDMKSITLNEYLNKLISACKEYVKTEVKYTKDTLSKPSIVVNGKYYVLDSLVKLNDTVLLTSSVPTDIFAKYEILTGRQNNWTTSLTEKNEIGEVVGWVEGITVKTKLGTYRFREAIPQDLKTNSITDGTNGKEYKITFCKNAANGEKPLLKIGINSPKQEMTTYVVNNNDKTSDVISFSVSSNGIAATAAISSLDSGSTAAVDVRNGQSLVASTDLGGLIPLNALDMNTLFEKFSTTLSDKISTDTSKGQLVVVGSYKSSSVDLTDVIRVYPKINNGETFWCGDYDVFSITDDVDSSGFKTTFDISFNTSKYSKDFDEKKLAQKTQTASDSE